MLIIYKPINADRKAFVDFWTARYSFEDNFYNENIGKELTADRILDWFAWKNGMELSPNKRTSVKNNFVARRHELINIRARETAEAFLNRFDQGGAIWRIFWLHLWQPARFPIYDQHVHRAMRFIQEGVKEEIPANAPEKITSYLNRYLAFHSQFDGINNYRDVDKALWALGKFISENNFPHNEDGPAGRC